MLVTELMQEASPDTMKSWLTILEPYFSKLDSKDYQCLYDEIYETIYGEVLSDEKAKRLVWDMKPYGEHWTMEQVEQAINNREWKLSTRYYTLNMMYNDYHSLFQEDTNKYVELALMWLEDEDSDGGDIKTYRYALYV